MSLLVSALAGSALLLPTTAPPMVPAVSVARATPRAAPEYLVMAAKKKGAEPEPEPASETAAAEEAPAAGAVAVAAPPGGWGMKDISPDGALVQRVQGQTRKTWKFNDLAKDRVQVAVGSEGRPVKADIQLWLGPDWTPFSLKAYSEDGNARPIQTLIGTRNKAAMIEVRNVGEYEFPFDAASNYAKGAMAALPHEIPATIQGERVQGGALASFPVDPEVEEVEVLINTDGRQLNARVELLNAPNNPKQTFEVFTNNGELNSLCVSFKTPDAGNTIRIVNLAPVEFPAYAHINPI